MSSKRTAVGPRSWQGFSSSGRLTSRTMWVLLVLATTSPATSQDTLTDETIADISEFVEKVRACRGLVAVSLSVVQDGKTVIARGFGPADSQTGRRADGKTPFCIGSLSKAFTSTLLAMQLAERSESGLTWDTPLHCLPGSDISFNDKLRASQASLRDLLAHKLGVPAYFTTLLVGYPENTSRKEVTKRTRFMEPTAPFRTSFLYNNYMYNVAGYVSELLANGTAWEETTADRIFRPAKMASSGYIDRQPEPPGLALPYVYVNGTLHPIDTEVARAVDPLGPAGAIYSTAEDMTKWIQFHLAVITRTEPQVGPPIPFPGDVTLDDRTVHLIWQTYQAQMAEPPIHDAIYRPYFPVEDILISYAMGWMRALYRGYRKWYHTGGISTYSSLLQIFPDVKSGIFVSSSGPGGRSSGVAASLIANYIADHLLGERPWLNATTACSYPAPWRPPGRQSTRYDMAPEQEPVTPNPELYTGSYGNYGFGVIRVYTENNQMFIKYGRYGRARLLPTTITHYFRGTWLDKLWYLSNQDGTKLFQIVQFEDFSNEKAHHLLTYIDPSVLTTFERDLDIDTFPPVAPRDPDLFVCAGDTQVNSGINWTGSWCCNYILIVSLSWVCLIMNTL